MGGLSKIIGYKTCSNCGEQIAIRHKKRLEHKNIFCNKKCEAEYKKSLVELNCECEICHKKFHRKPSHITKYEHHYCSIECHAIGNKELMKGENNHQYGLKGDKNSSWKSDERISAYGYMMIRKVNHPFRNSDDFVFEHRLVAEQYLLNDNNSIEINGIKYLSEEYHVHHLDFDRLNNNVENLYVVNKNIHMKFHNSLKGFIKKTYKDKHFKVTDLYTKNKLKELFFNFLSTGEIDIKLLND